MWVKILEPLEEFDEGGVIIFWNVKKPATQPLSLRCSLWKDKKVLEQQVPEEDKDGCTLFNDCISTLPVSYIHKYFTHYTICPKR